MNLLKLKTVVYSCSLYLLTNACFAFIAPTNSTLTLRLINKSSETLTFTGVSKTNLGNNFTIMPRVILPGGAATIVGTTTPYVDLVGKLRFRDTKNFSHLLNINDPRMINFKQPLFSIHNDNLISFVKPSSFVKNENQSPDAIAYPSATVVVENGIKPDRDHTTSVA